MYFTKTPDGYIQDRADEEILVFKEKTQKASFSARKRWDANASGTDMRTDMRTHMQPEPCERNATPDTIARSHSQRQNPKSKKNPPYPPFFESFWSAYPRKIGKAAASAGKNRSRGRSKIIVVEHWTMLSGDLAQEGIDATLIQHISPIEWDNVILYGQYVLDRGLVR